MAEPSASASRLPLVVKVGGSLAETGRLQSVLDVICAASRPVVVVPGGGPFVDKVRDLQRAARFDDRAAHRLAMLGMHQMAELFVPLNPRLQITDTLAGIATVLAAGRVPVWVPLPTLDGDATIPQDWSITSDGIAARLAELIGGAPVVLLKSVASNTGATAEQLAADGVVDEMFPVIVARAALAWHVLGPADDAALARLLVGSSGFS